jgi:hypothetical protein
MVVLRRAFQKDIMKLGVCAIFAISAAAAASQPGSKANFAKPIRHDYIIAAGFADDGNEDLIYDNRPMVLLQGHSRGKVNGDWLKFGTDACGRLQRVDSRHSMLRQSSLGDDMDQYDEDDPANEARQLVGQWLSQHAEIAVVNDGVDKSCDDAEIVDGDGDTLEIA